MRITPTLFIFILNKQYYIFQLLNQKNKTVQYVINIIKSVIDIY